MNRDGDKGKVFVHRVLWLLLIQIILILAILGRLVYLQVVQEDKYRMLSDSNRIGLRIVAPPRGIIVDRKGIPLAVNNPTYRAQMISEQTEGRMDEVLQDLGKIIPLTEDDYAYIQKEVKRKRVFMPITIAENLSWDEMAKVQVNAVDLPGIIIEQGLSRNYTYPFATAHLLGYLGLVDDKDRINNKDPLLELSGFKNGKTGLERTYDDVLRGKAGSRQVEVNVVGREVRELAIRKGIPGDELRLTIDIGLQDFARKVMEKHSGAIVVADVNTGAILAMVSAPSFDVNIFNRGILAKDWNYLLDNKYKPLVNKAISGEYAPGSTFKMMVALAALEEGIVTEKTKVNCEGYVDIGEHRFHCWQHSGHGSVDLRQALAESCDSYFYVIAPKVGVDKIAAMAKKFGLGLKEGVDLSAERAGLIPTRDWKQRTFHEQWHYGETMLTGIGQSYVLVTPLQLAMMTARIANGGKFVKPYLVEKGYTPVPKQIDVDKHNLDLVREGMFAVVNEPYGSAYGSRITDSLGGMSGKTGTSQVKRITREEREDANFAQKAIPWEERNHAVFVGYAPVKNPKYAIAVLVEHGGGGAAVAAPIASKVLKYAITMDEPDADVDKVKKKDE